MTIPDRPWDSGLQSERTKLAWQRTALSSLAFSLVVTRLIATRSVVVAVIIGALAVLAAVAVGLSSAGRYRRTHRALHAAAQLPTPGRSPRCAGSPSSPEPARWRTRSAAGASPGQP